MGLYGTFSFWLCLVKPQYVDGLGELPGAPRAAAQLPEDAPGLELGVRAFSGAARVTRPASTNPPATATSTLSASHGWGEAPLAAGVRGAGGGPRRRLAGTPLPAGQDPGPGRVWPMIGVPYGPEPSRRSVCPQEGSIGNPGGRRFRRSGGLKDIPMPRAPPAGFEPAHPAPEAGALSPELWGPSDSERLPATRHRLGHGRGRLRHDVAKHGSLARVTQALGRVLVVDDDEVIRQLIAVNLTLEGFDVATAVDGQDCLDKVQAIAPDVITLDVMMPRLDGWETAVQLRKTPETAHIKVVLITARAQEDDIARGANVGADAYLTKPFDPGEMIRVVRELAGAPPA